MQGNSPRRFFERQMTKNYQAAASGKRKCIRVKSLFFIMDFASMDWATSLCDPLRDLKRPKLSFIRLRAQKDPPGIIAQ